MTMPGGLEAGHIACPENNVQLRLTAGPRLSLGSGNSSGQLQVNQHTCWCIGYLNYTEPASVDTSSAWPSCAPRLANSSPEFCYVFNLFSLSSLESAFNQAQFWAVETQRKIVSDLFHLCLHQATTWLSLFWCSQPNLWKESHARSV